MDFILKWQEKLKEMTTSLLTIKIHNELETLKVIMIIYGYMVNFKYKIIIHILSKYVDFRPFPFV